MEHPIRTATLFALALLMAGCLGSGPLEPGQDGGSPVSGTVHFLDTCPSPATTCQGQLSSSRWEYGNVCFSIDDFLPAAREICPDAFFNRDLSFGEVEGTIAFEEGMMTRSLRMRMQTQIIYSQRCVPDQSSCEEVMASFLEGRFGERPDCSYLPYQGGEMYCVCRMPWATYVDLEETRPVLMTGDSPDSHSTFEVDREGSSERYDYCATAGESLALTSPAFGGVQVGGHHWLLSAD